MSSSLRLRPARGLPGGLVIAAAELDERFSRSSGPGGQGVNTADSRVQLSLNLLACSALSDAQRTRAIARLGTRAPGGVLTVDASEYRSQARNRAAARERLALLLSEALAPPPETRRATSPGRGVLRRRQEARRRHAATKAARRGAWD